MPATLTLPSGFAVALRDAGLDPGDIAREAGLPADALAAREPELTPAALGAVYDAIFAPPRGPEIGLRLGHCVKPELFGVVGLAALSAPTYGAAIARCARYKRLLGDVCVEVERQLSTVRVRVVIRGATGAAARGRLNIELAFFAAFGERMAAPPVAPLALCLRDPRPADPEPLRSLFGCTIHFGSAEDALILSTSAWETPLLGADGELHGLLTAAADRRLDALDESLLIRARAIVEGVLPEGPPPLDRVARRLAMSGRTLQRSLRAEGTTFTALVDGTRRDLALRHLRGGSLEIIEIAFLVGFSHLSSFYRAFRRWTGSTPEELRREARAP